MKKRAILYTRVSTDEQAEKGYSLQYQLERLTNYCQSNNITVVAHFQDDHSAKTFDRPEFNKLLTFCKSNHGDIDLILFINWSRFSRNAGDSYGMISKLTRMGIEAQAIEQPLDLSIPENKMMLAFYLAAPEVENDRRSINVIMGMRRARKEGRWMGTPPKGYRFTRDENNKPILIPNKEAELVREAFQEFARNIYTAEELRLRMMKKGFKLQKSTFPLLLRNQAYIGKVLIHGYKDEQAQYVKGIHEPLIDERTFHRVQDILLGRGSNKPIKVTAKDALPLRGFLECKQCGDNLTGSASKGNGGRYYYYHCQPGCSERFKAEVANKTFIKLIRKLKVQPEVLDLYYHVILDEFKKNLNSESMQVKELNEAMAKNKLRIQNAQKLMLDGELSAEEYKQIKVRFEEANDELLRQKSSFMSPDENYQEYLKFGINLIKDMDRYYEEAALSVKQLIVGSIFPGKIIFDGNNYRTTRVNEVIDLIYQNTSKLGAKKIGMKLEKSSHSDREPPVGIEPTTY